MDAEDFIAYLGRMDNSPQIRRLLATLGVRKHPKIEMDDIDARVRLPRLGLNLIFEFPDPSKRSSRAVLNEVQFYCGGKPEEMKRFEGKPPFGLMWSDSRATVRKKLGKPTHADNEMDVDSWDYENCSLTVEYAIGRGAVALVHLEVPFEPADDDV